ncbi:MAG TPA: hypothetical protein VMV07_11000 [Streptosporangiaceae bacterium]|nr:hypothetical protein [Streptosporangiaceae bacterium]
MDRNRASSASSASADNWPTQQLWPAPGPGGNGGYGPPPPTPPTPPTGPHSGGEGPRRSGRLTRWVIGLTAAAVLVGGGAIALASTGQPATNTGLLAADSGQAASSGQAATLNTVLSAAGSPSAADLAATAPTGTTNGPSAAVKRGAACARAAGRLRAAHHPRAARRVGAICRHRLARVRLLVRGIHGQFTFQTKRGAKTLAFERGTIQSVSGAAVTVSASDGTTWTWHLVSTTVVRQDRKKVASSSLADGQRVFVGGPVVSGADNARLIVIRPATSTTGPAS